MHLKILKRKYFYKKIATIPVISPPRLWLYHSYFISLSNSLLLRISPKTFAFIPILPMILSSLNRSNSNTFCHILPYSAPLCKVLHYSKTGVPWQTKSTRILIKTPFKMRYPAAICSDLRGVNSPLCIGHFCT